MKSHTDIEQSKKLTEILPIESADMCFANDGTSIKIDANSYNVRKLMWKDIQLIPCWSLAALLEQLPDTMLGKDKDGYVVMVETMGSGLTAFASNPVDACYEMILKINEQKLL